MYIFFVLFFTIVLASPFPQNPDESIIEDGFDIASSSYPGCTPATSNDLSDENTEEDSQDGGIFRRQVKSCPVLQPATRQNPRRPSNPSAARAPPPSNSEKKIPGDPPDYCTDEEYQAYLSCGGPEVRHSTSREILFVTNCVPGKVYFLLIFHFNFDTIPITMTKICGFSGEAEAIEAHDPWEKAKKIAQYCCSEYLPMVSST